MVQGTTKYDILERYFGYPSFREGQEILIDAVLAGQDVLGIMPTGAGAGAYAAGNYRRYFSTHFSYERSGQRIKSGRNPRSLH